ncbi:MULTISPECIES: hypothetical protein [unclassified Microcoleus]
MMRSQAGVNAPLLTMVIRSQKRDIAIVINFADGCDNHHSCA